MQSAVSGKDGLPQPTVFPSPGYDKLFPKVNGEEGREEGLYVGQDAINEDTSNSSDDSYPKEGGEKGLHVSTTEDQEGKECGEVLPLATILNQESVDSEDLKGYSPTAEEQELLSPPLRQQVCMAM